MGCAPTDGTIVWGKNPLMDNWVKMKFGIYRTSWEVDYPDRWVVVVDPNPNLPVPAGSLIIPDEWIPV